MSYHPVILVDSGILVAYYSARDDYHRRVRTFFERCTSRLVTTTGCITEVMWLLSPDWRIQNRFLDGVTRGVFECTPLLPEDFSRIAELNEQYADLPGDFADLSLVAISERLNISAIVTIDRDFDIYRRYRSQPFKVCFCLNNVRVMRSHFSFQLSRDRLFLFNLDSCDRIFARFSLIPPLWYCGSDRLTLSS